MALSTGFTGLCRCRVAWNYNFILLVVSVIAVISIINVIDVVVSTISSTTTTTNNNIINKLRF